MHSPSALTEHVSLNLAGFFLLDPVISMLPHNTALEGREHFGGGWLVLSYKVHTRHITFTQSQTCPTQDDKQGDRWTDSWKITHILLASATTRPKQIVSLHLRARAYRAGLK